VTERRMKVKLGRRGYEFGVKELEGRRRVIIGGGRGKRYMRGGRGIRRWEDGEDRLRAGTGRGVGRGVAVGRVEVRVFKVGWWL